MSRRRTIKQQFVRTVPDVLEDGIVYVSIEYTTAVHRCCCGCGEEVVTPLSPTDWKLIFDGERISLYPSIGNWSFACRSHYWIRDNAVHWARDWSREEVEAGRAADRQTKDDFYEARSRGEATTRRGWSRFLHWLDPRGDDPDGGSE